MQSLKIMIVEDVSVIGLGISHEMSDIRHIICGIASNGAYAIQLAAKEKPDIIIMDINLKDKMDGTEIARQINSRLNKNILFVTGYSPKEVIARSNHVNPNKILVKPVNGIEIQIAIEKNFPTYKTSSSLSNFQ